MSEVIETAAQLPAGQEPATVLAQPAEAQNIPKRRRFANRLRNGKVARLPFQLRELVSRLLFDGYTHTHIVQELHDAGYLEISRQNVTNWARGGYKDWLKQRQAIESIALKSTSLQQSRIDFGRDNLNLDRANNLLAAARFHEILQNLDPKQIASIASSNPELFFRVVKEESKRQQREQEKFGYSEPMPSPQVRHFLDRKAKTVEPSVSQTQPANPAQTLANLGKPISKPWQTLANP